MQVVGIIIIVLGVIFAITVLGAAIGIPMIIQGVVITVLGTIYKDVKAIKEKMQK